MRGVLVTGAGGGIGAAVAELLAERGFGVVGMQRRLNGGEAPRYVQLGGKAVLGDVTRAEDRAAAVTRVRQEYGGMYGLVNVAGMAPRVRADLLDMTPESYDEVMDTNLRGLFFLTQLSARAILASPVPGEGPRGAIVNISSISAYASSVNRGEYCISKAGASMVTRLFADRLAGDGVLVNEVRPGIIRTGMTAGVQEKYDGLIAGGLLPLPRWGEPMDVAKAVLALMDGTLPYTTGESLDVDGGFHLRRL